MKKYENLITAIRAILKKEWDPIPGTPADEYDSYVTRISSMLVNEKADATAIASYLLSVERDRMGFRGNEGRCRIAAEKISAAAKE